jgi:hypothetical protein
LIDETDRLISETALKSSLEVLDAYSKNQTPPAGHVAAAAAALMKAVGILIHAARLEAESDPGSEESFPVTPQTLRASLPEIDIAAALGKKAPEKKKRQTASEASLYLKNKAYLTFVIFFLAVVVHLSVTRPMLATNALLPSSAYIPASGFLWALVGSLVWILMRFRSFGAAYAFDPAHATVFDSRVFSGSVLTAILLLFLFGGDEPMVGGWEVQLPLWGFVIGYAGKLQVEILRVLVARIDAAIKALFPPPKKPPEVPPTAGGGREGAAGAGERPKPPSLGNLKKPEGDKK